MAAESVVRVPFKQTILLPMPRLEIEFLEQEVVRKPRRFARLAGIVPTTHNTHRWRTHDLDLQVRAEIRSEDEDWAESFYKDFIIALPGKTVDSDGNLVEIRPDRAVRGGYAEKMVEVFIKRSIALYIDFLGGVYNDEQVPLILDVNLVDGVTYEQSGE
jgi:hypothetical protein